MSGNPEYTRDVVSATALLTTANLNLDGVTGAYVTAYTFRAAGAAGGRGGLITGLTIDANSVTATAVGMVNMYINGALVRSVATTGITPSVTVKPYQIPTTEGADINGVLTFAQPYQCAPGDIVKFSTTATQNLVCRVMGGEF